VKVAMIKWRILKNDTKQSVDLTPQISKRAFELYELRREGNAVQDWIQAEREIRKHTPPK
jgi:hypothetical protein